MSYRLDRTSFDEGRTIVSERPAPGRMTLTSRLHRSARDDNGVRPGAEQAVAGLGGGGQPLPTDVRERFEGSLGADLGAVRVHTGESSAAAADAVGARAFAIGNDVHFAAGQYAPADPFGIHLLAHEVAHTVQQGGAPGAPQYKLEVSTPGDAHELEADRAADAMVAGAPARISRMSAMVSRKEDEHYDPTGLSGSSPVAALGDATAHGEINWHSGSSAIAVDLGTVPPVVPPPKLAYDDARKTIHPDAASALDGVAAEAHGQYQSMTSLLAGFKKAIAEAEKASIGVSAVSTNPMVGLDNTKEAGASKKLGDVFKGNQLDIIDSTEGSLDAMNTDEKKEIVALKRDAAASIDDIKGADGDMQTALEGITSAKENVQKAVNNIELASNAEKIASNDADAAALEVEKGRLQKKVEALGNLINVTKGIAGLAGEEKGGAAADAISSTIEIVSSSQANKYDRKIEAIKKENGNLTIANAGLATKNAVIDFNQAVRAVDAAIVTAQKANTAYKKAVNARTKLYADLSVKMEAAMIKNGVPAGDVKKAQSAIQAIPLLEDTISKLQAIAAAGAPPEYSAKSGHGASMCTNLGDLLVIVGLLKGYRNAASTAKSDWQQRLASVNALLAEAQ